MVVVYSLVYTKQAVKDVEKIKNAALSEKVKNLISVIKQNPFKIPPPYEKLLGDLQGAYSRRINIKHRLVYQVFEDEKIIKIISIWSHYENV